MSKGNLFLGMARGKVGDVVFTRNNGQQVTRVRNRNPKNPRSPLQRIQRVILKTAGGAYSALSEIADHSFQGVAYGAPSQQRFLQRNIEMLRSKFSLEFASGEYGDILESSAYSFLGSGDSGLSYNPWVLSAGTLPIVPVKFEVFSTGADSFTTYIAIDATLAFPCTYAEFAAAIGLHVGDQLTFIVATIDDRTDTGVFREVKIARIILAPDDGDGEKVFISSNGTLQSPNSRNEGVDSSVFFNPQQGRFYFSAGSRAQAEVDSMAAGAVIASRQSAGGVWQRSDSSLVLRDFGESDGMLASDHGVLDMARAAASFLSASARSDRYLNQAE